MKSYRLICAIIGGWLLFIGFDSANGNIGRQGASKLPKPLQFAFLITRTIRTIIMFLIAVVTFFLVAKHTNEEKARRTENS